MTIDELWAKTDAGFARIYDKLDSSSALLARHDVVLGQHTAECRELKARVDSVETRHDTRLTKLEQWKWFMLGTGAASGAAIGGAAVKLFAM